MRVTHLARDAWIEIRISLITIVAFLDASRKRCVD